MSEQRIIPHWEYLWPKGGKPPKYKSVEEMQVKIAEYFANCPQKMRKWGRDGECQMIPCPTMTGLALYLGFGDKGTLWDYAKKPEFEETIKVAKTLIENKYEIMLNEGNVAGAIFALKQFGWKDNENNINIASSGNTIIEVIT